MKKILKLMLASAVLALAVSTTVHAQTPAVYNFTGLGDTIKTVTTKNLDLTLGSPGAATVQFAYKRISDTLNATVTLLASIDGTSYAPYPGASTLTIPSRDTAQLWFIQPQLSTYQLIRFLRLEVKSTKANGQGRLYGKLLR